MGRVYTAQFENVAVTATQDFCELVPADDKPIKLHAIFISQSTELGDAAEEQLRVQIIRGFTSSGSGGSGPTPVPLNSNDVAAGCTVEVNNTAVATTGTTTVLHSETFNVRTGWIYLPTPEMQPSCSQANTSLVIRLLASPADSITMGATIYFEELV